MTSPDADNSKEGQGPLDELRRELEQSATGGGAPADDLSRITDVFIVRHPGLAPDFRRELERVCEASGLTADPGLLTAASADFEIRTVASQRPIASRRSEQLQAPVPGLPETIGRCRILGELGRGGMGTVLLAQDPTLRRRVAIKVLPAEFAQDPMLLERFRREATAVTELEHPAIVPIYEIGTENGLHYYIMRHVDGRNLRDWCRERMQLQGVEEAAEVKHGAVALLRTTARHQARAGFSVSGLGEVLRVFEDISRALHHAHERGIIHRDIKPANIMVDRQGFGQLLDFGLARIDREVKMTRTGLLLGTVAYMAPEQISNAHGEVDARSDVFALGVSLFECLTGTRPFMGETAEATLKLILDAEPPSPVVFLPELARDVETIVLKCLEKRPQRRYQSAQALAEDLARVRAHGRIEAQAIGRFGRALRWAERHRGAASAALAAVIACLTLLGVLAGAELLAQQRAREARAEEVARVGKRFDLIETMLADREQQEGGALLAELDRTLEATRKAREIDSLALAGRATQVERWLAALPPVGRSGLRGRIEALLTTIRWPIADPRFGNFSLETDPPDARFKIRDDQGRVIAEGALPISGMRLAVGSYVCELSAVGHVDCRYPLLVVHGDHWGSPDFAAGRFAQQDWTLRMPREGAFDPKRFEMVPGGPYLATVDRDHFGGDAQLELDWQWLDAFVIARDETTAAAWQPFLDDPVIRAEIEGRPEPNRLIYLPRIRPNVPSGWYLDEAASAEDIQRGLLRVKDEARPLALGGVSYSDAQRYLAWHEKEGGEKLELPTSKQWEKAARGVDGRLHPWGDDFDWSSVQGPDPTNFFGRMPGPPGSAPRDLSPYGLRDMAGNVREWCRDGGDLGDGEINPWLAGGDCSSLGVHPGFYMTWPRNFVARDNVAITWGFRVVLLGVLP